MDARQELLTRLKHIIGQQLGVRQEEITEESNWTQLGADSLDRLGMSLAVENAFKVDIPHGVGERLNTVGETVDHLLRLIAKRREISHERSECKPDRAQPSINARVEAVTTDQQWVEMSAIRTQVFTIESGFSFRPLPGPVETKVWHFLARDKYDAIGTLSVVDTTADRQVHQRYRLNFAESDRVARYAQLAILKPYRKRGIFEMLIETAQSTVIRPNGFAFGWLLYPAAHAHSSKLTRRLGFAAEAPLLTTEFGTCHVLIRRECNSAQVDWIEDQRLRFAAAAD